ncbi:ROK family transcriptional regulator [Mediterraneibacter massiliensis]|uniref:ROK family transcriptional regulator n=1 Tax=Mediterraneibacter massiliensis TaxID=1720300 RepID=UPI000E4B6079|nr:ROK family transcriptional regulator [Mediterraneibacter massiliensis]RGT74942.1 ROK family transcriptional regulator [Ruminococcus sp. AF18-22]
MKIYNPTDIGDRNKLSILRLIKTHDGISRQEISKRLHLSAPAVSNNVSALIENGIIYENGRDDTSLGRKPRQLSYKGDLYYVISVELMPKKVRAGMADLYGNIRFWEEREISVKKGVDEVLAQLDAVVDSLLEKKEKDIEVIAIAIGVPALTGQNDLNDLFSTYLSDWKNVDLKEHVFQKYRIEAIIVNDVELALIGEREKGVGKKQTNIIYIKYGEGFAARAIVDGYLLKGNNMAAGELGYYLESLEQLTEGFTCPGRFEQEICNDIFSKYGEADSPAGLLSYIQRGDKNAESIIEKIIQKMAVVIANTVLMLNSEMVILGGVSELFTEKNLADIKSVLEKICPFVPEVVPSKLGMDAPIIGGIKVALDYAEEQIVMLWKS